MKESSRVNGLAMRPTTVSFTLIKISFGTDQVPQDNAITVTEEHTRGDMEAIDLSPGMLGILRSGKAYFFNDPVLKNKYKN